MIRLILEFSSIEELKNFLGEEAAIKLEKEGQITFASSDKGLFEDVITSLRLAKKIEDGDEI